MPFRPSPKQSLVNPALRAIRSTEDLPQRHRSASSDGEKYGDITDVGISAFLICVPDNNGLDVYFSPVCYGVVIYIHPLSASKIDS